MHQALAIEFASHGYVVFVMDHHDGTCSHTENSTGYKTWPFDIETEDMKNKVAKRVLEIKTLVDVISDSQFLHKGLLFNQNSKLYIDKLIVCGQNLGALTALATAEEDPRIKCMLLSHPKMSGETLLTNHQPSRSDIVQSQRQKYLQVNT